MTEGTNFDPSQHIFWLASRASGIVAMALLSFAVIVGLMAGGKIFPGFKTRDLQRVHEFTSLAAIAAIAAHGALLIGDQYLHPSVGDILVPFAIAYKPLFTGLGIIAGWVAVVLGLSYYARGRIGAAHWRKLHRFIIIAFALSVVHVLGAGTDAVSDWLRVPLLGVSGIVIVLFLTRISGGASPQRGSAAAA